MWFFFQPESFPVRHFEFLGGILLTARSQTPVPRYRFPVPGSPFLVLVTSDSVGTSASPEKRILLEESVDRSSNDLSSLATSTPVKAVRNASVRKIQIPPLTVLFDLRSWSDQRETILAQKTKLCYHNLCEI